MKKIILTLGILAGILTLAVWANWTNSSQEKESQTSTSSSEKEFTKYDLEFLAEMGLNPDDYIPLDNYYAPICFFSKSKVVTDNYNNLTVDNINEFFPDTSVSVKTIFEKFGRPHIFTVTYEVDRTKKMDESVTYYVEARWCDPDTPAGYFPDYVMIEWPLGASEHSKSVYGQPSDSSITKYQIIVEDNEFKGALRENEESE